MKRMLILAVTLWVSVSATAHAQANSSAGTQPRPQVSAQTGAQVDSPTTCIEPSIGFHLVGMTGLGLTPLAEESGFVTR
jgi:hypothetical protein